MQAKPYGTDLVRRDSIEELCGHRERALDCYNRAFALLLDGLDAHRRASPGKSYVTGVSGRPGDLLARPRPENTARFAAAVQCNIDQDMWRTFITGTPLGSLMDAEEREAFNREVEKNPPEVTPDTVFATMARLAGDAELIFRRGLVNAFGKLCRAYRSHDGFKIGDRVVLPCAVSVYSYGRNHCSVSFSSRWEDEVRDVDRVMHVLDGKPAPDYQQGICAAMRDAMHNGRGEPLWTAETEYFRAKWFKNGNVHLWFKRADLVERANKLIAEHYGEALGAGPDAASATARRRAA